MTQGLEDVPKDVLEDTKFEGVLEDVHLQKDEARSGKARVRKMNVGRAAH